MTKRLRIIAGPNGSGKTSVYEDLVRSHNFNFGIFVNADEIEAVLSRTGVINFRDYSIEVTEEDFLSAYATFRNNISAIDIDKRISVNDNFLVVKDKILSDSYFACFVADFIRNCMLSSGVRVITIETVMSHPSKLDFMKFAKSLGYKVYLYYVTTDSCLVNIDRVAERKANGGHGVPEDKIEKRYYRSLENLYEAITLSDRAYLFDNSGKAPRFVAEYDASTDELMNLTGKNVPEWLKKYVINIILNESES